MSEKELQKKITNDLSDNGIKYLHIEKGRYNNSKQHRSGIPDLIIFPGNGSTFFIELKSPTGKLKKEQQLFQQWALQINYKFYVIRTLVEWSYIKKIHEIGN
jgi:hypothetical protein